MGNRIKIHAMENKLVLNGQVDESGTIVFLDKLLASVAKRFCNKPIMITVERKRRHRTNNQNAYYWAVIVQMIHDAMNEAGEQVLPQEVHEFLKFRFLRIQKIDVESGELLYEYSRSTASLYTAEFGIYLDRCIQFAKEFLNTTIPPPNTQTEDYLFPEYIAPKETREEYLERIWSYLEQTFEPEHVEKYYKYGRNAFQDDAEIKALFRRRYDELKK